MDPTILYTSADVHQAIRRLLADPDPGDRRVVIVAYLGMDAASYLPNPRGLEVVCAPEDGTSMSAIRSLLRKGAVVRFSDALHMKVYFSSSRGCVITSANCSTRALGANPLKEAGVLLPPGAVDIERLLRVAVPRECTSDDVARLDRAAARVQSGMTVGRHRQHIPEFDEWDRSPFPQRWLLSWWEEDSSADVSEFGRRRVREEEGRTKTDDVEPLLAKANQLQVGDWVLCYWVAGRRAGPPEWLYVHKVHKVPRGDPGYDSAYPYEALQIGPISRCPMPPFRISPTFRQAFQAAVNSYGVQRLYESDDLEPPQDLIALLRTEYSEAVSRHRSRGRVSAERKRAVDRP